EEASDCGSAIQRAGLDRIYLLAPTSDLVRMREVAAVASGFVYYVSVKGVTGDKTFNADEVAQKVALLRSVTSLPIGVGFGIKSPAAAAALAAISDAVIVGSALVEIIERGTDAQIGALALEQFVATLRRALDASRAA
ncbi:MAG: tryptophan synthase subunit alpha, partial [Gammaproteobacteria bacterium]